MSNDTSLIIKGASPILQRDQTQNPLAHNSPFPKPDDTSVAPFDKSLSPVNIILYYYRIL